MKISKGLKTTPTFRLNYTELQFCVCVVPGVCDRQQQRMDYRTFHAASLYRRELDLKVNKITRQGWCCVLLQIPKIKKRMYPTNVYRLCSHQLILSRFSITLQAHITAMIMGFHGFAATFKKMWLYKQLPFSQLERNDDGSVRPLTSAIAESSCADWSGKARGQYC